MIYMDIFIKNFGQRIKELRETKKITQEQLAELIGVETNTLSRIENGINFTTFDNLKKLADFLDVEIKDLFEFKHQRSKEELIEEINKILAEKTEKEVQNIYKTFKAFIIGV
jgi:transcriptional regulator with XRE-family HTH domain